MAQRQENSTLVKKAHLEEEEQYQDNFSVRKTCFTENYLVFSL